MPTADNEKNQLMQEAAMVLEPHEPEDFSLYTKTETDNEVKVSIKQSDVISFWESLGYRKLKLPQGGYELVKISQNSILKFSSEENLMHEIKNKILKVDGEKKVWDEFLKKDYIGKKANLAIDIIEDIKLNVCSAKKAYFFFKNGVLEVKGGTMKLIPYEEYPGFVFEEQIINHNLIIEKMNPGFVFDKFLENVSGSRERYDQLTTTIGYLIHPYKDPTFTRAVILVDESLDFSGEANGGTGKSLIGKAISKMTNTLEKDGKNLSNKGNRFFYQDLNLMHRVMNLDDVYPDFDFEMFYSVVTGDLVVEKKFKDTFKIPFELSPKLLISSNYMVLGSGGYSEDRRKIEIEITPYYNADFTPVDDFGCKFFSDWDEAEWNSFYLNMAFYCQKYIREGVINCPPINLGENKLKAKTNPSFVEFADSNFVFPDNSTQIVKNKSELYNTFRDRYPIESRNVSNIKFKKWIDVYCKVRNLVAHHYKSDSNNMLRITKNDLD